MGPCFADCLESIARQSFGDFEVIIIDGGSTDSTLSIASDFLMRIKFLTIITRNCDDGIYDAMNVGIRVARGMYLYFLGGSDSLYSGCVLQQINSDLMGESVLYGNVFIDGPVPWGERGQLYDGRFDIHKLLKKNICHQAIFYASSCFKDRGYNRSYKVTADWDINIRLWLRRPFRYTDRIIANFKGGGVSAGAVDGSDFSEADRFALLRLSLDQL